MLAIELAVEAALRDAGFDARVERVMAPAWTTDWITPEGRDKLRAYGIAPPAKASNSIRALFGKPNRMPEAAHQGKPNACPNSARPPARRFTVAKNAPSRSTISSASELNKNGAAFPSN